ncbi:MAG: response regulator [Dehalococcoidia bacterium]|nr:MAG: response regulator [Dehalococcoidia bacterium]
MGVKKVLVIDDNIEFIKLLKITFGLFSNTEDKIKFIYFTEYLSLLDYYEENISDIVLVISDIDMPGMNGNELYRLLLIMDPKLKFVLVTGSIDIDLALFLIQTNVCAVYQKPIESIVSFIREVLSLIKT